MAMSPGKPPLEAGHQLKIAPTTSRVPPNIINCFPIAGIAIAQHCTLGEWPSNLESMASMGLLTPTFGFVWDWQVEVGS